MKTVNPEDAPIFIGGASRSGTTLLRVILDSHPRICCGPEFRITPVLMSLWEQFREREEVLEHYQMAGENLRNMYRDLILTLLERLRLQEAKPRLAEKTPDNCLFFQALHEVFPESPIIHVIRDGRDVVASLLAQKWEDINTGEKIAHCHEVEEAANLWVRHVKKGMSLRDHPQGRSRYFEVRYEQLIQEPESILRSLFRFIGENFDNRVLEFHTFDRNLANEPSSTQVNKPINFSSMGRWRRDLDDQQRKIVFEIAGDLLKELGYWDGVEV